MRFFYLYLLLVTALFTVNCSSESKEKEVFGKEGLRCYEDDSCDDNLDCIDDKCVLNKCKNIECDKIWAECDSETGECNKLKDGFCVLDGHCNSENNEVCDQTIFKCKEICIEGSTKCSENGEIVKVCNKNKEWEDKTVCDKNDICQKMENNTFDCRYKCSTHDNCQKKEICNDLGQCLEAVCSNDSDCMEVKSINSNELLYCDVLAIPKTCIPFEEHSCGGESSNDISSNAENIDITDLKNNNIVLNKQICIMDQDWYKINLTNDVNSLNFKINFDKGDLDLIIVDENFRNIGYSMASNNIFTGGEESVSSKYLPKGIYYIHIYRYKTSDDTELTIDSDYTLTISGLDTGSKCTVLNKECETLKLLRSVCDEVTGACIHSNANKSVELGDLCEEKTNCNDDASYGCFDMEIEGIELDNYCTKICSSDEDCNELNMVCQSLIVTSVCVRPCSNDNDCKLVTEDENAICNNGKCE